MLHGFFVSEIVLSCWVRSIGCVFLVVFLWSLGCIGC